MKEHLKKYWWVYLLLIIIVILEWQYYKGKWPFLPKEVSSKNSEIPASKPCPAGSHKLQIACFVEPCPEGPCVPDSAGGSESNTGNINDTPSYA